MLLLQNYASAEVLCLPVVKMLAQCKAVKIPFPYSSEMSAIGLRFAL
jgi:hypothetical protein